MNPARRTSRRPLGRSLPYALTAARRSASGARSAATWPQPYPMNRLLQGDVGSGKTDGRRARDAHRDRGRLPGRVHGADRDPRRAAPPDPRAAARRRSASRVALLTSAARGKARRERLRAAAGEARSAAWSAPTRSSRRASRFRAAGPRGGGRAAPLRRARSARRCAARASGPDVLVMTATPDPADAAR